MFIALLAQTRAEKSSAPGVDRWSEGGRRSRDPATISGTDGGNGRAQSAGRPFVFDIEASIGKAARQHCR